MFERNPRARTMNNGKPILVAGRPPPVNGVAVMTFAVLGLGIRHVARGVMSNNTVKTIATFSTTSKVIEQTTFRMEGAQAAKTMPLFVNIIVGLPLVPMLGGGVVDEACKNLGRKRAPTLENNRPGSIDNNGSNTVRNERDEQRVSKNTDLRFPIIAKGSEAPMRGESQLRADRDLLPAFGVSTNEIKTFCRAGVWVRHVVNSTSEAEGELEILLHNRDV